MSLSEDMRGKIEDLEEDVHWVQRLEKRIEELEKEKAGAHGPALQQAANDAVEKVIDGINWILSDPALSPVGRLETIDKYYFELWRRIGSGKPAI